MRYNLGSHGELGKRGFLEATGKFSGRYPSCSVSVVMTDGEKEGQSPQGAITLVPQHIQTPRPILSTNEVGLTKRPCYAPDSSSLEIWSRFFDAKTIIRW